MCFVFFLNFDIWVDSSLWFLCYVGLRLLLVFVVLFVLSAMLSLFNCLCLLFGVLFVVSFCVSWFVRVF